MKILPIVDSVDDGVIKLGGQSRDGLLITIMLNQLPNNAGNLALTDNSSNDTGNRLASTIKSNDLANTFDDMAGDDTQYN